MDVYKWDVIYACSGAYINAELAANKDKYIQDFSYEDSAIKVTGTFGAWSLVPGGSEGLLQFETPITTGSVLLKAANKTLSLDGAVPLIQMQLDIVEAGDSSGSKHLVFNCKTIGKTKGDATPGAVTVIDPDTSGKLAAETDGDTAAALLVTGLAQCLINNQSQLSFMFAQIMTVPSADDSWLTPKKMTYVYQQHVSGALGGIAILGVLTDRDITHLPKNFDTDLLANNSDFGFVLCAYQFMENVIRPSLASAFGGTASSSNFFMTPIIAELIGGGFNLNSVKVGAIHYTPNVKTVNFHITDTSMRCYTSTKTDIKGLTSAYVTNSVTSNNQSHFDPATRALTFLPDPHKSTTSDKHIPWWEKWLGALTLGIMNAVIDAISLAIENAVGSVVSSKTANSLGNVAPGLVQWHGQVNMTVTNGGLSDNFYMVGKLK